MEGSLPILDGKTPFDRGDSCLVNEVISNPTNHSSSLPISLPGIILGGFPSGKVDSVTSNTLINVDPTLLFSGDSFQNLIDVFEGNGFLQEALHGFQRSLDLSQPITLLMNPLGSHIVWEALQEVLIDVRQVETGLSSLIDQPLATDWTAFFGHLAKLDLVTSCHVLPNILELNIQLTESVVNMRPQLIVDDLSEIDDPDWKEMDLDQDSLDNLREKLDSLVDDLTSMNDDHKIALQMARDPQFAYPEGSSDED